MISPPRYDWAARVVAALALAGLSAAGLYGLHSWLVSLAGPATGAAAAPTYEELTNSRFGPPAADPYRPPAVTLVPIPDFEGAYAVWGATGRDSRGHVWFGVSASGVPLPSAHLFEYAPETGQTTDRGDVVAQLRRSGVYRAGERQMKIHSKIVQGPDGYLYFASMDEEGEITDGSKPPTWGSHLWRLRPPDGAWEHLFSAPEGLIAVARGGPYIYALGYFDHVVYQYDCATGRTRSAHVGAAGGHVSRNFLADERGHVYVPRLKEAAAGAALAASLVELDASLREAAETPIAHYSLSKDDDSHGIVGFQPLADHSIVFATDRGWLYRVTPHDDRPADVTSLGWFHPLGEAYVASMFTYDGREVLTGASRRQFDHDDRYEWLVYNLSLKSSVAVPMPLPPAGGPPLEGLLLYGSVTRDDQGDCYLAGTCRRAGRESPVLLRVRPAP